MIKSGMKLRLTFIILSIFLVVISAFILKSDKLFAETNATVLYQLTEQGISVNQTSMSYVIHTKDDKIIVIDGGNSVDDANYLLAKLKEISGDEVVNVDAWVLTHPHSDHLNSFILLMENSSDKITIDKICYHFPSDVFIHSYASDSEKTTYNNAKSAIEKAKTKYGTTEIIPGIGDKFIIGSAEFEILWSWDAKYTSNPINESSLVFKVYTEGQSILFTGDIGPFTSDIILNMHGDKLKSDVVQMSHHGSNGLLQSAYNTINPYVCLWPTSKWVWEGNTPGASLTTLTTRSWMTALGVSQHYISYEGDAVLRFPMQFDNVLNHEKGFIAVNTNTKVYYSDIAVKDREYENVYYEDAIWLSDSSNVVVTPDYITVLKPGIYNLKVKCGGAEKDIIILAKDKSNLSFSYDASVFDLYSKKKLDSGVAEDIVLMNDFETSEEQAKLQVHEQASHETVGNRLLFRALDGVWVPTTEVVKSGTHGMKINVATSVSGGVGYTGILIAQPHSTVNALYYQLYLKYTGTKDVPIGKPLTDSYAYNAYGNPCDGLAGTALSNTKIILQQNGSWVESTVIPAGYDGYVRFAIGKNEQKASSRGFSFRFNQGGALANLTAGSLYIDSFSIVYTESEDNWVQINDNTIQVNSSAADIELFAYLPSGLKESDFTITGLDGAAVRREGNKFILTFNERVKTVYSNVSITFSQSAITKVLGSDLYNDLTDGIIMLNDFETPQELAYVFIRECYKDEPSRVRYAVITDFGSSDDANTGSKAIYANIIAKGASTYNSAAFSHVLIEQNHSTVGAVFYQLHIKYTGNTDLILMSFACNAYQYTYAGYGQGPNAINSSSLGNIFYIQNQDGDWIEATKLPAGYDGYIRLAIPRSHQIENNKGFTFRVSDTGVGDTDGGQLIIDSFAIKKFESNATGISVYKDPYKTAYNVGDKFNPSGLRFNVTFDSGISKVMRYETLSDKLVFNPGLNSPLSAQNTKVTVNYGTLSCNIDIAVGYKPAGDSARYMGSQIRSTLVPYKNKDGVIVEDDLRQGLRFCFDVADIGDSFDYDGTEYIIRNIGALVILKSNLTDVSLMTVSNVGTLRGLQMQSELKEVIADDTVYKSAYIYNIPVEHKDTVICARAFLECEDSDGTMEIFYTGIQERSLTEVYNAIIASGSADSLSKEVKKWWQ